MLEECKKIALDLLGDITNFLEEKDCFIFYNDEIKEDGCVVVLKKNKKVVTMTEYIFRK